MRYGCAGTLAALAFVGSGIAQEAVPANDRPRTGYTYVGTYHGITPAAPAPAEVSEPPSPAAAALCSTPCADKKPRCFGSAEFLMWFVKSGPIAYPLVTTAPPSESGAVGEPGTIALYGDDNIDYGVLAGLRARVGYWCNANCTWGVEAIGLFSEQRSDLFGVASNPDGTPVLARPFTDLSGASTSLIVAFPDALAGSITTSSSTRFWGGETNALCRLYDGCGCRIDGVAGVRYFALDESLNTMSQVQLLGTQTAPFAGGTLSAPATLGEADHFGTLNQFYGSQLGFNASYTRGRYFVSGFTKVALGFTHQIVDQNGVSFASAGPIREVPAGLLVNASNRGHHNTDRFAVLPEVGVQVGCNVTKSCGLFVGYNFLYLSSVVRPGDQIDRTVDPAGQPSLGAFTGAPIRPSVLLNPTDFWVQGVSFGATFRY